MKIWFQNRRYKNKRARLEDFEKTATTKVRISSKKSPVLPKEEIFGTNQWPIGLRNNLQPTNSANSNANLENERPSLNPEFYRHSYSSHFKIPETPFADDRSYRTEMPPSSCKIESPSTDYNYESYAGANSACQPTYYNFFEQGSVEQNFQNLW